MPGTVNDDDQGSSTLCSFIDKIDKLPRISEELHRCKTWCDRIQKENKFLQIMSVFLKGLACQIVILLKIVMESQENSAYMTWSCEKMKVLDRFMCHHLEFFEEHLQKVDTLHLYEDGGIIDKGYLVTCLVFRLFFIFPRLALAVMKSVFTRTLEEFAEDAQLILQIISPKEARRSQRLKEQQSLSPGKNRKHKNIETKNSLPEYFYVHEDSQESDSDFVPDSDGDDTEMTSASDRSHSGCSEEDVEVGVTESENNKQIQSKAPETTIKLEEFTVYKNEDVAESA